jgi:hypothetical protein
LRRHTTWRDGRKSRNNLLEMKFNRSDFRTQAGSLRRQRSSFSCIICSHMGSWPVGNSFETEQQIQCGRFTYLDVAGVSAGTVRCVTAVELFEVRCRNSPASPPCTTTTTTTTNNNNNTQWHYSPDGRKPPLIRFHSPSYITYK